ncbi:MAG: hypothetical protein RhofKO_09220 [Rhodothermales bacterium]
MLRFPPLALAADGGAASAAPHFAATTYRKFFELSLDLVCIANTDGYFLDLNPSFTRVLGYTLDALSNKALLDFVHPDDREATLAEIGKLAKGIPAVAFENRYRHKEGHYIWLSWNATPDDDGLLYAIAHDVTEQKETERELSIQTEWLKRAEEMAKLGHWRVDVAEGAVEWSDEVYRIHGLDPATFTPTLENSINAYHPDDRERVLSVVQAAMLEGTPFNFDLRLVRTNGSIRYVRSRGEVALNSEGHVETLFGVFLDVTDDHDLRDALALSEIGLTSIFEAVPDAVVFFDADYRIQRANPAFAFLFGFATPRAAQALPLEGLLAQPQALQQLQTSAFADVHEHGTAPIELAFKRHDQTTFTGEFIGVKLGLSTTAQRGYLAVIRDVTQRRANVQALKAYAETLQRRNDELQQFAFIASHDLQEPLRTISSFTSLFAKRYRGHVDETADDFIRYIVDAANRMQTLINDLLSYSRIGRWEPTLATIDTGAVVREVLYHLESLIEEHSAVVHIADSLPPLTCDARMLRILLTNVLNNGLKYNTAEVPTLHIRVETRERETVLVVEDNGIGIEPRFQQRIFEMFKRLHGRDQYSGTGIGLAVCKKVMDAHNGSIWVESTLDEGATFYAAFPHKAA